MDKHVLFIGQLKALGKNLCYAVVLNMSVLIVCVIILFLIIY